MRDKNIKLPNFLIVGAAKSGTTSLHNYLEQNSAICMSKIKEPKYFSFLAGKRQFNGIGDYEVYKGIVKSYEEYISLFKACPCHSLRGESSADYLYYYADVIPLIKKYLDNPRIIIILRNPVERAFSAYTHLVRDNREKYSFEKALELEEFRIKKGYEFIWHYKKVGKYYKQVKHYITNFTEVKIFLFDDLKANPQKVVDEICEFLEVDKFKIEPKIYNKSGIPKDNWKTKFYNKFMRSDNNFKSFLKKIIPEDIRKIFREKIREEFFEKQLEKASMKPETRQILIDYYREDILKLQDLIKRDLTHWLK